MESKLLWKERPKEKSLIELRYNLANKELLRIRNLTLHYNGTALDENKLFGEILYQLEQSPSSTSSIPHKFYCCLPNAHGLLSLEKRSTLLDYLNSNGIDILFVTETWLDKTYVNKTLSVYGQFGVFSRTDRQSSKNGGVTLLLRRPSTAKLIEVPLIDKFDFASGVVLFLQNNVALQIRLVYLPPKNSSYIVSCDVFCQCIIDSFVESKKMIQGHYKRSLCLRGHLNLPNATWALMCSPIVYENHIFTTIFYFNLFSVHFSATHKGGNILDNVLCHYPWFFDISGRINFHINNHFLLMFTLYDNTETLFSNPLTSGGLFFCHP